MTDNSVTENKRIKIITWVFAAGITLVYFFVGHRLNFATDTFATFDSGYEGTMIHMAFDNGRLVTAFFYYLFAKFNVSNEISFYILYWGGIICLTIAIYELIVMLRKHIGNISFLIAPVILINVFIIDYYLFLEALGFCMGIMWSVYSAKYYVRYMEDNNRKNWWWSLVFLLLGILCYQAVIGVFVAIILPFVIYFSDRKWDRLINFNAKALAVYAIVNGSAFVMMAFAFHSDRVEMMGETVGESLKIATNGFADVLLYSDGILDVLCPSKTWFILLVLMIIVAIIKAFAGNDKKDIIWKLAYVAYIVGVLFLLQFVLYMIGRAIARVSYPMGAIPGTLLCYIFMGEKTQDRKPTERTIRYLSIVVAAILMICELAAFGIIFKQRYESNALDKEQAIQIGQALEKYETEHDTKISFVAFYYDEDSKAYWDCITYYSDTSCKAMSRRWSHYTCLNYYMGREFYVMDPVDEINDYFKTKDWDEFIPEEQIIYGDGVAHICIY